MLKNKPESIDHYIKLFPPSTRLLLEQMRDTISKAAPDALEAISYGMPTFKLKGNLVHFAAYKNHIGFYPAASGIHAFAEELSPYAGSKGAVRFPLNSPLPHGLLARIVKYRVKENLARAAAKGK